MIHLGYIRKRASLFFLGGNDGNYKDMGQAWLVEVGGSGFATAIAIRKAASNLCLKMCHKGSLTKSGDGELS